MLHVLYYALGILVFHSQATSSNPTTYDQRQTGDLNVQIHLKDVQVVALLDSELLDDYTDYDYSYDYGDFTIKPILKPTSSPVSTSSVKPWYTWPTNPSSLPTTTSSPSIQVDSSTSNNTEQQPASETNSPSLGGEEESNSTASPPQAQTANNETEIKLRINDKAVNELFSDATVDKIEGEDESIVVATSEANSKKQCPSGYTLNKKGRCRGTQSRKRISLVPLTMRLGSRLSQKGRFTVRKDLPIRFYRSDAQQ